jgi:hypothetical protein
MGEKNMSPMKPLQPDRAVIVESNYRLNAFAQEAEGRRLAKLAAGNRPSLTTQVFQVIVGLGRTLAVLVAALLQAQRARKADAVPTAPTTRIETLRS